MVCVIPVSFVSASYERICQPQAWCMGPGLAANILRSNNSNQVDLRILNEMGVSLDKAKYETKLQPVQKFRAGVFAVMAAIRMSNLEEQWRDARIIGEEVKLIRAKQARVRSRGRVLEV